MSEEARQTAHEAQGTLRSYIIGFVLSIVFTLGAYFSVVSFQAGSTLFTQELIVAMVLCFALLQLLVQLIFFLHLGKESNPKWNLGIFISTISIVLIVVVGSIWIMTHLNYNMMPEHVEEFLIKDEGFKK